MPKLQPFQVGAGPDAQEDCRWFYNGKYQVAIRRAEDDAGVEHFIISIRREDRRPIMDWRDLQWIKNQLLGPEEEMLQLFPAESRLVDTSNQYWFFCYPGQRWPFGFNGRLICEGVSASLGNGHGWSEQRPFAIEHRPTDLDQQNSRTRAMLIDLGFQPKLPKAKP